MITKLYKHDYQPVYACVRACVRACMFGCVGCMKEECVKYSNFIFSKSSFSFRFFVYYY